MGRMFDVLGNPIDGKDSVWERSALLFTRILKISGSLNKTEIFETGIKVIDLICPFVKGGKVGLFGGAGVGKP